MHPESSAEASSSTNIDLSHVPADDRERVWFEKYYLGDKIPQLTTRAVVMGGIIGAVMSWSNLYTTLKLGWSFGVTITACVISYTVWNGFVAVGLSKTRMSILENNCMQSTAAAAGSSTGGTLATAVGALLLINGDEHRMGWFPVAMWVMLVAFLGVFLAIPMKRQMINVEQLTFPSGIAAAETLKSLYAEGEEAVRKARVLIISLVLGGFWGAFRATCEQLANKGQEWAVYVADIPLKFIVRTINVREQNGAIPAGPLQVNGEVLGLSFEPSALMIAAGMIVGFRVSLSMMVGAILHYVILGPMIAELPTWVHEGKHFVGHVEAILGDDGTLAVLNTRRWSLWSGTAMMVTSGLTSFAMSWRTILRAFTSMSSGAKSTSVEMDAIEVPTRWMFLGMVPVTVGLVGLCWLAMGINPLLGLFSIAFSFALSLVACRATGETDTTPIGALGKITQFVYAVLAPADKTVNLMTAGITAGAAGASADLLTDLKSGYLLGANPRQQFLAQFFGVFFGVAAVVPAWYLLVPDKAALEAFHSPATSMWFAVAEALAQGVQTIPESARWAILIGGAIGVILPLIEANTPAQYRKYLPSTMGLGLAGVVTFSNALSFFIGAVLTEIWMMSNKQSAEKYVVPLASGVVAGESLMAVVSAVVGNMLGFWKFVGLQ